MGDSDERAPWSDRRRDLAFALGLLLALGGSYIAINEAFDPAVVCGTVRCIEVRNPEDIWLGAVVCVIGVVLMVRNWRRR